MSKIKGIVSYVGSNAWKGKTLYSLRVQNEDKWFNLGETPTSAAKGDFIEFEYTEHNGKNNIVGGSIVRLDSAPSVVVGASTVPSRTFGSAPRKSGNKDDYWEKRLDFDLAKDAYHKNNDIKIQYQSARNAAISVVDILVREKALKLPAKEPADAILGKIEDLTNEFFAKTSNVALPGVGVESESESNSATLVGPAGVENSSWT